MLLAFSPSLRLLYAFLFLITNGLWVGITGFRDVLCFYAVIY